MQIRRTSESFGSQSVPRQSTGGFGAYSVKRLCTTSCKPYLAQPMPMRRAMRGPPAGAIWPGWGLQRLARTIVFYDLVGQFWGECEPKSVQLTPQRLVAGRPSLSLRMPRGARTAGCSGTGAELQRPARAIVFHDGEGLGTCAKAGWLCAARSRWRLTAGERSSLGTYLAYPFGPAAHIPTRPLNGQETAGGGCQNGRSSPDPPLLRPLRDGAPPPCCCRGFRRALLGAAPPLDVRGPCWQPAPRPAGVTCAQPGR